MNKKGFEMSINVVVGIILGILMLSAGIIIFGQIICKAEQVSATIDDQTRDGLLRKFDEGEKLWLPETDKVAEQKKVLFCGSKGIESTIFDFGIRNINSVETTFNIELKSETNGPTVVIPQSTATILARDKEVYRFLVNTRGLKSGQYPIKITIKEQSTRQVYAERLVRIQVP